jgi:ubiquinone/menaquinone biosynthesis C-methylase UbiE
MSDANSGHAASEQELLAKRHEYNFKRRSANHYASGLEFVPANKLRALDAGCGSGGFALPLAERAQMVVGLDRNEALIARAKAKQLEQKISNVAWVVGDIEQLPFASGAFDFVGSYNVLHLVDEKAALGELSRCLTEKGRLVVRATGLRTQLPTPLKEMRQGYRYWQLFMGYVRDYGAQTAVRLMANHSKTDTFDPNGTRFDPYRFERLVMDALPGCSIETEQAGKVVFWER